MNYFTPDLWLRLQSGVSRDTFQAADDQWERGVSACAEEVARIIPSGRPYLHLRRFALREVRKFAVSRHPALPLGRDRKAARPVPSLPRIT